MPHKKIINSLIIMLVSIMLSACVSSNSSKDSLSKPEEAKLYLQMGVRYLEMDMLKIAKENLETAESIDPNNATIHNSLGALYERLKMFPDAREQYRKAVALDTSDAAAKNNYGRFLCERGNYEEGMELLNEALALPLNNRKWFAYTNIGRCELRNGKQKLAEANFRMALQRKKNYSPALFEMQKISYHSGKYMSARAFLERYLSVARHNPATLWYAVQTERALGNEKLARIYKEKLSTLFPTSKEAQQLNIRN
jgi:type IV pilus assembly protein PilF